MFVIIYNYNIIPLWLKWDLKMGMLGNWVEIKRQIIYLWVLLKSSSVISVTKCGHLVQMRDQLLPEGGIATPSINKLVNYSAGHFVIVREN